MAKTGNEKSGKKKAKATKKKAKPRDQKLTCVTLVVSAVKQVNGQDLPAEGYQARVRLHDRNAISPTQDLERGTTTFHLRRTDWPAVVDLMDKNSNWATTHRVFLKADDAVRFVFLDCKHGPLKAEG